MAEWERALELIDDEKLGDRAKRLAGMGEYGFAHLLQFYPIESIIKVIIFFDKPDKGWPKNLNLQGKGHLFGQLEKFSVEKYEIAILAKTRSASKHKTLREFRNSVAHEGYILTESEYGYCTEHVTWVMPHLKELLRELRAKRL